MSNFDFDEKARELLGDEWCQCGGIQNVGMQYAGQNILDVKRIDPYVATAQVLREAYEAGAKSALRIVQAAEAMLTVMESIASDIGHMGESEDELREAIAEWRKP